MLTVINSNPLPRPATTAANTAFGCPREFAGHRFIYTVISPRARGLSVGVDMNPDKLCNFNCAYCEINRDKPSSETALDVGVMVAELEQTLEAMRSGALRQLPSYAGLPDELLKLRQVALSGDGEPTLCPNFIEAVEGVTHLRACGRFPFFKLVLITNASGLDRPAVQEGLRLFTPRDEVWAKLDAGSQEYFERVNRPDCTIEKILTNILQLARQRPVIIQTLFPSIKGMVPSVAEIQAYGERLKGLVAEGAQIPLVQIYSATRPTVQSDCGHLQLRQLSEIARQVRSFTGLRVEVF